MPVKCPSCGRETSIEKGNPCRPFCSERCKLIDLGRWVAGDYRVPVQAQEQEDAPPPAPPSDPMDP